MNPKINLIIVLLIVSGCDTPITIRRTIDCEDKANQKTQACSTEPASADSTRGTGEGSSSSSRNQSDDATSGQGSNQEGSAASPEGVPGEPPVLLVNICEKIADYQLNKSFDSPLETICNGDKLTNIVSNSFAAPYLGGSLAADIPIELSESKDLGNGESQAAYHFCGTAPVSPEQFGDYFNTKFATEYKFSEGPADFTVTTEDRGPATDTLNHEDQLENKMLYRTNHVSVLGGAINIEQSTTIMRQTFLFEKDGQPVAIVVDELATDEGATKALNVIRLVLPHASGSVYFEFSRARVENQDQHQGFIDGFEKMAKYQSYRVVEDE